MPRRIAALILAAALALALSSCAAEPATIYAGIDELPLRQPTELLLDVTLALHPATDPSIPINLDADTTLYPAAQLGENTVQTPRPVTISVDCSNDDYSIFTLILTTASTS